MSELANPLVCPDHEDPSGLVSSVPPAPTVTQRPPPNDTAARFGVPRGLPLGPIVAAGVALALALTLGPAATLGFALGLGSRLVLGLGLALRFGLATIGVGRTNGVGRGVTGLIVGV